MVDVGWIIEVDWGNDGTYVGTGEDVSADVQRIFLRRGRDNELGRIIPGECEIVLRNDTGVYSPDNTGSPITGLILPGRKVRLRSVSPVAKTHFLGYLEDIIPEPTPGEQIATIRAVDGAAQVLATKTVRTPMFASKGAGSAVGDVLDRVGWSGTDRLIDTGQTTFGQWFVQDESALDALHKIEEAERGLFLVRGDGYAIYEDRHHRLKGAHLTSQATFTATMIGMNYQSRLREIKNEAVVKVYVPFAGTSGTELWRLRDYPFLPPNTRSILVIGESSPTTATAIYYAEYDDPATSIVTPVSGTDFTFNSQADGLGTDLTSQLTVAFVTSFAKGGAISVTNAGPFGGYLTLLKVRGTPQSREEPLTIASGDATSQTTYGKRSITIDNDLVQSSNDAQDYADYLVSILKDGKAYIQIDLANLSAQMTSDLLTLDISDRITIVEGNTGVNGDYSIEQKELEIEGSDVKCSLLCSKVPTATGTYLILDDATYGLLNTGILGF